MALRTRLHSVYSSLNIEGPIKIKPGLWATGTYQSTNKQTSGWLSFASLHSIMHFDLVCTKSYICARKWKICTKEAICNRGCPWCNRNGCESRRTSYAASLACVAELSTLLRTRTQTLRAQKLNQIRIHVFRLPVPVIVNEHEQAIGFSLCLLLCFFGSFDIFLLRHDRWPIKTLRC